MRASAGLGFALCIVLCCFLTDSLAESDLSIVPGHGTIVPIGDSPTEITIRHPGAPPEFRVIDAITAEVPGVVEPRGEGTLAFVPETSPLPEGQYTVEFPDVGEVFTFTVGPDVYSPRPVAVDPDDVARDTTVVVTFSEPLDPGTVSGESVRVYDVTGKEGREVEGTISLDPTGTKIVFTPESWAGFTPEGTFRIQIDETVTDLAGNEAAWAPIPVETDEETLEDRPDLPRVTESIFWSSKRDIGVFDLGLQARGTFDSNDVAQGTLPGSFQVGVGDPDELVIDPRANANGEGLVYGVDPKQERVVAFNTATGEVFDLRVAGAEGIAIDPAARNLFVTMRTRRESGIHVLGLEGGYVHCDGKLGVRVLPFRNDRSIDIAHRKAKPVALAVSPDGTTVACLLYKSRAVALCDPSAHEPHTTMATDKKPQDLTFVARPDGGDPVLLVACRGKRSKDGTVLVFNGRTGDRLGELTGFRKPVRITAKGQRAWVAERGARRITAIDVPAAGMPTKGPSYEAGPRPMDVAFSPDDTGRLFVVNGRKSRITVLSEETGEILGELEAPGAIAVTAWGEN